MTKIQRQELLDAIDELQHDKHTLQTCEKLAAVYTVLNNMYPAYPEEEREASYIKGYSSTHGKETIGDYGDSDFLRAIAGKNSETMWRLMDEAMEILAISNPRLYDHIMSRI